MNEYELNQKVAERICQDLRWADRRFRMGDCVALLDGNVVAIADTPNDVLSALRSVAPDPARGMVVEVAPPVVDVIR